MSAKAIVWLHGDSLSPRDPALLAAAGAPAIFVFDEPFLQRAQLSFKRLAFLYESALEALAGREHALVRGEVAAEVAAFATQHGANTIHVTASVSPRFRRLVSELRDQFTVVVHEPAPFVGWRGSAPRRFSAFWRKVEAEAMRPTGDGPPELTSFERDSEPSP